MFVALTKSLWSIATPDQFQRATAHWSAVPYRTERSRGIAPLADVYLPPERERTGASVVVVHGGGFLIGTRRMKAVRFLTARLIERGVAVCAIDYRMIFRGGRLDEATDDVVCGIAWWREQCEALGLPADRVSVAGISAGASLTALAGTHARVAGISRMVLVFGAYDFEHLGGLLGKPLPRWLMRTRDREVWRSRSPLNAELPRIPTLLVHGTEDQLTPIEGAYALAERRKEQGLPTQTLIFEGQPHAFLNWVSPVAEQTTDTIAEFVSGR